MKESEINQRTSSSCASDLHSQITLAVNMMQNKGDVQSAMFVCGSSACEIEAREVAVFRPQYGEELLLDHPH